MKAFLVFLSVSISLCSCGIIDHTAALLESAGDHHEHHHERATSYQNIHIEHFHPIDMHFAKEHHHLLEHPIPIGKTVAKVEIHHGGKHDHGYALASVHSDVHGHHDVGHDFSTADVGHHHQELDLGGLEGHQEVEASYQVQDHHEATGGYELPLQYAHHE